MRSLAAPSCVVDDQKSCCAACTPHGHCSPLLYLFMPALCVTLCMSWPSACPAGSHGLPKDYGTAKRYLQEAVASGQAMSGGSPRQWSGLGDAYFYLGAGTA